MSKFSLLPDEILEIIFKTTNEFSNYDAKQMIKLGRARKIFFIFFFFFFFLSFSAFLAFLSLKTLMNNNNNKINNNDSLGLQKLAQDLLLELDLETRIR